MDRFLDKNITLNDIKNGFKAIFEFEKKLISLTVFAAVINSIDKINVRYVPCSVCGSSVRNRKGNFEMFLFRHLKTLFPAYMPKLQGLTGTYFTTEMINFMEISSFQLFTDKVTLIDSLFYKANKSGNVGVVSENDLDLVKKYAKNRYKIIEFIEECEKEYSKKPTVEELVVMYGLNFEYTDLKALFKQQLADGYTIEEQIKFWNTTKSFVSKHRKIISEENE